ncbi:hypothetical protein BT93_A0268 [Corymbia citriodora subsp. variegata]|nr:hypothetical protein BT93_A0268 [Corymbia citriodora subsp. variegata]
MKVLPLLFIFFSVSLCEVGNISEGNNAALERQIKMMNKPPVKTFVTAEGDTIDCIDIDKQPSLEHPLLKNHKVQKEPTFHVTSFGMNFSFIKPTQFGLREPCPIGTVPISRMTKKDLIRARALPRMPYSASSKWDPLVQIQHTQCYLQVVSLVDNRIENIKYGAYGRTSIYNITVARDQFSSHNIWIQNGSTDHVSMIVAGWTGNGYRDGCFNLLCPGFVLVDRRAVFNTPLNGYTYGGHQYELAILVQQAIILNLKSNVKLLTCTFISGDENGSSTTRKIGDMRGCSDFTSNQDLMTGNWWLMIGYPPVKVGYWPMEIFSNLQNGALVTAWGGTGFAGSDGVCPPIGSGHKPDGDYRHATYFRILNWIDANGVSVQPSKDVVERVDSDVYDLKNYHYDRDLGYWIGYGGPGGYCYYG